MPNITNPPAPPTGCPCAARSSLRARRARGRPHPGGAARAALVLSLLVPSGLGHAGEPAKEPVVAVVTGLAPGDLLNVRATASPYGTVLGRLPIGTGLENFGCAEFNGYEWCKVTTLDGPRISGWAPSRYLQMAGPMPAGGSAPVAAGTTGTAAGAVAAPPPANLAERLGGGTDPGSLPPEDKALAEKLRNAVIAAYGPAYPRMLEQAREGTADGTAPNPSAVGTGDGPVAAGTAPEAGAGVPVPTPRPDQGAAGLVASVVPETAVGTGSAAATSATDRIPCAAIFGRPMTECGVKVTRSGPSAADVSVSLPDGGVRVIRFRDGRPEGSDSGGAFRYTREGSLNMIRIGEAERFEILDAVALGR